MHLQEEIRQALLKRGYILVLIGGGITGDIQVNDTHLHAPLKAKYRELEIKLMLKQLKENPQKIPSPDRDEMMDMISEAMKTCRLKEVQNEPDFNEFVKVMENYIRHHETSDRW